MGGVPSPGGGSKRVLWAASRFLAAATKMTRVRREAAAEGRTERTRLMEQRGPLVEGRMATAAAPSPAPL